MWYPPATEVKAFPTAALSTSGTGNDDNTTTSGQQIFCPPKSVLSAFPYGSKVIPSSQPVKTSSPAFSVVKQKQEKPKRFLL